MDVKTAHSLGDLVYVIGEKYAMSREECCACGGSGNLKGVDDLNYPCSNCKGTGSCEQRALKWFAEDKPSYIRHIYLSISEERIKEEYCFAANGLSQYYPSEDLFNTQVEAQAVCDKRNRRRHKDDP